MRANSAPFSSGNTSLKRFLAATGVSVAILAVTACGGSGEAVTPAPESSVASTSPAAATPTAEATAAATADHNGIPVKGPAQNVNGKYLQTTINADDPIITTFDPKSVTGDAVGTFTEDELKEAVRVAQVFTAEEGIDSILNGSNDPADVDAWWAANKGKLTPKLQAGAYDYLKKNNAFVLRTAGDKENSKNIQYWYDENSPRVQIRENAINRVEVSSQWPNSVGVDTKLNFIIWGKDEAGNKYPINVTGNYYLNIKKDESTGGQWLIDGQNSETKGAISNK